MGQEEIYSDQYLNKILNENKTIASVGVSLNPIRPSYFVSRYLSRRGYAIIPVNPAYAGQIVWGNLAYSQISQIIQDIDMVQIFRKSEAVPEIVEDAILHLPNLKTIWMQIGVMHADAAKTAREHDLEVIQNLCPKMEHQRLSGELGKYGINTGLITSRLQPLPY
ncbi:MAG: CoA-binding protein [Paracoccaceae bacterium]|nr:CoA-binding protein [Paracoccaceae bacterium]